METAVKNVDRTCSFTLKYIFVLQKMRSSQCVAGISFEPMYHQEHALYTVYFEVKSTDVSSNAELSQSEVAHVRLRIYYNETIYCVCLLVFRILLS